LAQGTARPRSVAEPPASPRLRGSRRRYLRHSSGNIRGRSSSGGCRCRPPWPSRRTRGPSSSVWPSSSAAASGPSPPAKPPPSTGTGGAASLQAASGSLTPRRPAAPDRATETARAAQRQPRLRAAPAAPARRRLRPPRRRGLSAWVSASRRARPPATSARRSRTMAGSSRPGTTALKASPARHPSRTAETRTSSVRSR